MKFPLSLSFSLSSHIISNRIVGKEKFPLVLMLEPLHACNLTCAGCGRIREYSRTLDSMMSLDECLDSARESEAPIVSICGGEPLIYPQIVDLINALIGMDRHIYLCTNGVLLRSKLDEFQPSSRLILNVHLDGRAEAHDAIVCRSGVFTSALESIVAAKQRGFFVSTNTTVYRETDMADVEGLLAELRSIGVDSHLISPGYDYQAVQDGKLFLTREDTIRKFQAIDLLAQQFPLSNTPIYLEFLMGKRAMKCAAWGNPTRNIMGWRSPCYMLADTHYPTFHDLMSETNWDAYGPDKDERCAHCMVHCGFEPSAILDPATGARDIFRLARWNFS